MAGKYERVSPRFILAGKLTRNYLILPSGKTVFDAPGGNLLYAAAGLAIWEPDPPPGLIARVGEDYPREWLEEFERYGLDTRGVKVLPQSIDLRSFYAYSDLNTRSNEDPVSHFGRIGQPFPRALIGYHNDEPNIDSRTRLSYTSLRQADVIPEYLDATAAHLCPLDFLTHSLLPSVLRQSGFTLITMDPSPGYMNPTFKDNIASLLTGLTAFLPSEEEVRSLFHGRTQDLWEMMEDLASYGCDIVVVKRGVRGQSLFDASSRTRWEIPPYPARLVDPTGAGDSFCGGFLAGYRKTFDPLQAVLFGNISASLTVEGHKPYHVLEALPGLAEARLDSLRQSVRKI